MILQQQTFTVFCADEKQYEAFKNVIQDHPAITVLQYGRNWSIECKTMYVVASFKLGLALAKCAAEMKVPEVPEKKLPRKDGAAVTLIKAKKTANEADLKP